MSESVSGKRASTLRASRRSRTRRWATAASDGSRHAFGQRRDLDVPLTGYGLRYQFGLFKQSFVNGCQRENADDWTKFGDPWSHRRDKLAVKVDFADQTVIAVPYDMPVIGYENRTIGTLRLWQCEAEKELEL